MVESRYNFRFAVDGEPYVYNTLTGALWQGELKEQSETVEAGFYTADREAELQGLLEAVRANITDASKAQDVTLVMTEACNFQCIYCYQDRAPRNWNSETTEKFVAFARRLYEQGLAKLRVHYFGGEPLLNLPAMKELHTLLSALAKEYNAEYIPMITTNGSLLTEEVLRLFNFKVLQLTLDGQGEVHNRLRRSNLLDYEATLDKIALVLSHPQTQMRVRFNLCVENKHSFYGVIDDFLRRGFPLEKIHFVINPLRKFRGTEPFTQLSPEGFAEARTAIRRHMQRAGAKMRYPRALPQPCAFSTGKALCLDTALEPAFCTSSTEFPDGHRATTTEHFRPGCGVLNLRKPCGGCTYLPLCLGGCGILQPGEGACCDERYTLAEDLSDFIRRPHEWSVS